jgi:hypothetical protein
MAGEMFKEDLEEGGEYYETRKQMEDIGHKAGVVIKVEPFDTYQGPQGKVYLGSRHLGTIWSLHGEWTWIPQADIRIMLQLKSGKLPTNKMISYLKGLKEKLSHKPFEVLKGQKPSHYQTPKLKKEQQKSLLHLVKSKYQIVHIERK